MKKNRTLMSYYGYIAFICNALFAILSGVLAYTLVRMNANIVDYIVNSSQSIYKQLAAIIACYLGVFVLNHCISLINRKKSIGFENSVVEDVFSYLENVDVEEVEKIEFQNSMNKYQTLMKSQNFFNMYFNRLKNIVLVLCLFYIVFKVSVFFAIAFLVMLGIYIVVLEKSSIINFKYWSNYMDNVRKANYFSKILIDNKHGGERKIFDNYKYLDDLYEGLFVGGMNKNKLAGKRRLGVESLALIINSLILFTAFVVGFFTYRNGDISIGIYYIFIGSILIILDVFSKQFESQKELYEFKKNFKMHLNYVKTYCYNKSEDCITLKDTCIEMKDVSFNYENSNKGVKSFTFNFEKGKTYVIVGKNGAGKTTLCKLILGIYKSFTGEINVCGRNINNIPDHQRRDIFSVMFQSPIELPLSIEDNIALGKDTEHIENYILDNEFINEIKSLNNGFKSMLGTLHSGGINFSKGQWRKIFFSRALFNGGQITILDEPNASLDPVSEKELYENIEKHLTSDINIIISHRLGVVKYADEVLVMNDGVLVESGSHDELMDKGGMYHELYTAQSKLYE